MNNRAPVVLALLCSAFVTSAFALNPNDVAEAARILDNVTRIANETQILTPGAELVAPEPRNDTKGRFLSPYRSDGGLADWANKAIRATAGSAVAGAAADKATDSAVNQLAAKVPGGALVGGMFKKKAKDKAKEVGAVTAIGGWDYIRKTSDISFNSADDLAVYMHATHSGADAEFAKALGAAFGVYPELKETYEPAVRNAYAHASARAPKVEVPPVPGISVPAAVEVPTAPEKPSAQVTPTGVATPVAPAEAAPAELRAPVAPGPG
jgi:hypothetical protein